MLYLVDAHNDYQAGLNIEQVAREGYSALLVKATQGATGYTAAGAFDDWIRRARASGMIAGAYHWLTSASASAQLDHYLRRLDAVGGPAGLLCAVDVEDTENPPTRSILADFADGFRRRTGGHPLLLYTGAWWWKPRGWNGAGITPYLWASRYVSGSGYGSQLYSRVPESWWTPGYGGWGQATILQFSSTGLVAGKAVDVNAFRGSLDDLRALTRPQAGGTGTSGGSMAGEIADFAAAHVPVPGTGGECGSHMALGAVWSGVEDLRQRPVTTPVELSPEQVMAIRDGLAAEVVSMLTPQLRLVAQLADRLGAAGDALGALNDPTA